MSQSLPVRDSDEPLHAWKTAAIGRLPGGRLGFIPLTNRSAYLADEAIAVCNAHTSWLVRLQATLRKVSQEELEVLASDEVKLDQIIDKVKNEDTHVVPDLDCACGFYALDSVEEVLSRYTRSFLFLEVELYGRVLKGEMGYRAEKQRVLGVWVIPKCYNSHPDWPCLEPVGVNVAPDRDKDRYGFSIARGTHPTCWSHHEPDNFWRLDELANELQTEVRWFPADKGVMV